MKKATKKCFAPAKSILRRGERVLVPAGRLRCILFNHLELAACVVEPSGTFFFNSGIAAFHSDAFVKCIMSETHEIDINYVANLARLELSGEEKEKLGAQLKDILGYFEKLNAVDVEDVEPMAHAYPVYNVWREGDEPGETYSPEVLMQMAPERRENQVVVPKVVE